MLMRRDCENCVTERPSEALVSVTEPIIVASPLGSCLQPQPQNVHKAKP